MNQTQPNEAAINPLKIRPDQWADDDAIIAALDARFALHPTEQTVVRMFLEETIPSLQATQNKDSITFVIACVAAACARWAFIRGLREGGNIANGISNDVL